MKLLKITTMTDFKTAQESIKTVDFGDSTEVAQKANEITAKFEGNQKMLLLDMLFRYVIENCVYIGRKQIISEISKMS